jgi:hypothetical protein
VSQKYDFMPRCRLNQEQFVKYVKNAVSDLTKAGFFLRDGVDDQVIGLEYYRCCDSSIVTGADQQLLSSRSEGALQVFLLPWQEQDSGPIS